ncbi:MAG: queuosine salvage family protein [Patescibacteria group bacterium]|nr:queuosine salvage family protein [Patescibacteria group bacterium]
MKLKDYILSNSNNLKIVRINKPGKEFLSLLKKGKMDFDFFESIINKNLEIKKIPNFIFFVRVLDFRLWEFPENWKFHGYNEFYGLVERVKVLFSLRNLESITFNLFKKVISPLESNSLAKVRYKLFKEAKYWLDKNYQCDFENYFIENKDPFKFSFNLTSMKKFQDYYENSYFLKPNQLLYLEYLIARKIHKVFYHNLEELTIFSDYRIAQVLLNFQVISLDEKYLNKIKSKKNIRKNSLLENELRKASIAAGEIISEKLKIPSFIVDNLIWNLSQKIKLKIPFHRTKTIFY